MKCTSLNGNYNTDQTVRFIKLKKLCTVIEKKKKQDELYNLLKLIKNRK